MDEKRLNLGDQVRDNLTNYQGTIIGKHEWLHGNPTITIQSSEMFEGSPVRALTIEAGRVQLLAQGEERQRAAGGR